MSQGLTKFADELRTTLEGHYTVDPPEHGRIDLCHADSGLEIQVSAMDGGGYLATTTLYVVACPPGGEPTSTKSNETDNGEPPHSTLDEIRELFVLGWEEQGWELSDRGRWFRAATERDGPEDCIGYELEITRFSPTKAEIAAAVLATEKNEAWKLLR